MITTIGVSYVLFNIVLLAVGADSKNYPNPLPPVQWAIGDAVLRLREVLIWVIVDPADARSAFLRAALEDGQGDAGHGTGPGGGAHDGRGGRPRSSSSRSSWDRRWPAPSGLIFGLYYNFTSFIIGFTAGLRAFTAAVLGGIGNVPGAMLGGVIIGLIEAMGGQFIATAWTDVIIFSILVLVLVFRPAGLLGRVAPNKS